MRETFGSRDVSALPLSYRTEVQAGIEPATTPFRGEVTETYTTHGLPMPGKQSEAAFHYQDETAPFTTGTIKLVHDALMSSRFSYLLLGFTLHTHPQKPPRLAHSI